jgi:hypothetical protein
MTIRSFTDSRGVSWRVWATLPGIATSLVSEDLRNGWLTFDSFGERRRLSPIPVAWSSASDSELEILCASGERIRTSGPRRRFGID